MRDVVSSVSYNKPSALKLWAMPNLHLYWETYEVLRVTFNCLQVITDLHIVFSNVDRGYRGSVIYINSDSWAALMTLASHSCISKVAWDCHEALETVAVNKKWLCCGMLGHVGIRGKEEADQCPRKGAEEALIGPEPTCGIVYSMARAYYVSR